MKEKAGHEHKYIYYYAALARIILSQEKFENNILMYLLMQGHKLVHVFWG